MSVKDRADEVLSRAKRRIGVENPSAADADGRVGTTRGALRAFGEGDFDGFLDALRPDVAWEAPGGNFPGGSDIEGRDAVKDKFIGDAGRTFTEFGFVPESFLDADDENAVVVFGRFTGEGADGSAVDVPGVQAWLFQGSEAELVRIYTDSAAFPEVVTEQKLKEQEEEEKKKQEKKEQEESKAEDDSDSDDSDSDDSEDSDSDDSEDSDSDDSGGSEASKSDDSEASKSDDSEASKSEDRERDRERDGDSD
jgi:ketosteroid isomerase-like protein